jgi:hypothetical protein
VFLGLDSSMFAARERAVTAETVRFADSRPASVWIPRLDSFRLVAEKRKRLTRRIKGLQPEVSNRSVAKALGVHSVTIDRDVAANAAAEQGKQKESQGGGAANAAPTLGGAEAARMIADSDKLRNVSVQQRLPVAWTILSLSTLKV